MLEGLRIFCCEDKSTNLFSVQCGLIIPPYFDFKMFHFYNVDVTWCEDIASSSGLSDKRWRKKTNKKNLSTLPVSYFLFTVRHNKWLVSIPPENNITPAVAFCPCLPCLPPPVFSFSLHLFFSEHAVTGRHSPPHPTYTHTPPTLHSHLNSISPPCLEHSPFPCTNPFPSHSIVSTQHPPPQNRERSQHYSSRGAGEG